MSDAERWGRVKEVFDAAIACRIEDRPALLRDLCGNDRALQSEVESLLRADAGQGSMFDRSGDDPLREHVFDAVAGVLVDRTHALAPGDCLGPYQINGLLGVGGMGRVYRARDTTLGRDVALKILPDLWLGVAERCARFDREAQVLASLNHPNIGAIFGVYTSESDPSTGAPATKALVLELVEGETLADRLARQGDTQTSHRGLAVKEVVNIATQVIDALEAAHDRGIVHRDLKPANIKITPEGRVKVLDFGLARADDGTGKSPQGANSPTASVDGTQDGMLLGTALYMSPEQARGRPVDKRSDIWAFGCVLYEMLTGAPLWRGESVAGVLASVTEREPDWAALPVDTPPSLRLCVRRCLQRDLRQRFHDIADVRLAMEGAFDPPVAGGIDQRTRPWSARLVSSGWAIAIVAAAAVASGWFRAPAPANPARVMRLSVGLTPADELGGRDGRPARSAFALSPDGRTLVFSAVRANRRGLYIRHFDEAEATIIPGTDDADNPFFSPDGEWVGFFVAGAIRKLPIAGGPSILVAETSLRVGVLGASWGDDDRIVFGQPSGALLEVVASGGTPTAIIAPKPSTGEVTYRLPHVLPGSDAILFTVTRHRFPRWDQTQVHVYSRRTGLTKLLINGGADARYLPSGHLVYVREGVLLAVPFDLRRLEVTGGPVGVIADVLQAAYARGENEDTGVAQFAIAPTGTLVYLPGGVVAPGERFVVRVGRTGQSETLPIPPRAFATLRVSPDGRQLALNTFGRERDIWLYSLERGSLTKLSLPGRLNVPVWSHDGRWIAYAAGTAGADNIYRVQSDGAGSPEELVATGQNLVPATWTSAGQLLFYGVSSPPLDALPKQFFMNVALKTAPNPIPIGSPRSGGLDVSPDGHWIAYHSTESGQLEVYVQAHPAPGPRYQVSTNGGMSPIWRADGRELFYVRRTVADLAQQSPEIEMMAVPVSSQSASLTFGRPASLFEGRYQTNEPARGYDATPDGRSFLMIQDRSRPPDVVRQMIVVQNWHEELKRRVPTK